MRGWDLKEWLELFGIKLEPISGESAWQLGKHSRHLQVLKDQMSLLATELTTKYPPQEILSLALSAKNAFHSVRGYTPNQWAFGREHNRIASYLQQYDVLPLQSKREDLDFEKSLEAETRARATFIEADSKRRLARALRSRCRPLKEFETGELIYATIDKVEAKVPGMGESGMDRPECCVVKVPPFLKPDNTLDL